MKGPKAPKEPLRPKHVSRTLVRLRCGFDVDGARLVGWVGYDASGALIVEAIQHVPVRHPDVGDGERLSWDDQRADMPLDDDFADIGYVADCTRHRRLRFSVAAIRAAVDDARRSGSIASLRSTDRPL